MPKVSDIEIWEFLRAIESGSVALAPNEDPQLRYTGNITYLASNGWRIVIFNDCNEWDYIDEIVTSDGRRISYSEICNSFPAIGEYTPTDEIVRSNYAIPVTLSFRCTSCNMLFTRAEVFQEHKSRCKLPD